MISMVPATMNRRWSIMLPRHRAAREINDWWEAQRLAATHSRVRAVALDLGRRPRLLDVGSEEGDFPCLYSLWGADVFLVEPNEKAWPWIRETFHANEQTPAGWYRGLLGSEDNGKAEWCSSVWSNEISLAWPSVGDEPPTPDHGFHHLAEHGAVDPIVRLDDLVDMVEWVPDIITMDIEGGELHCLMGASRTLAEHRPELFVSVHPEFMRDLYGHDPGDLFKLMEDHNYRAQFICTDHESHWHFVPLEKPWPWGDKHDHTRYAKP